MNIIEAMNSKAWAKYFQGIQAGSWANWSTVLKSIYGLGFEEHEYPIFRQLTGRDEPKAEGYDEIFIGVGRRSGKSKIAALMCAHAALYGGFENFVAPSEKIWYFIIATDKAQSGVILSYIKGLLSEFHDRIIKETVDEIWLDNGACIGCKVATYRGLRGFSTGFVALDEMAFMRNSDYSNPDREIITALMPSLLPGAKLVGISTPFGRSGLFFELFENLWGNAGAEQVYFKGATSTFNPSYKTGTIDRLLRRDRVLYSAEYLGEFRQDVENVFPESLVRLYSTQEAIGLPRPDCHYVCYVDPSGGRSDEFAMCIGHASGGKFYTDYMASTPPPFDPSAVVSEYAAIAKRYSIYQVFSDRYGGIWTEDVFRKNNLMLSPCDVSASELFLNLQALLMSGRANLMRDEKLIAQLRSLERRPVSGGREKVGHPDLPSAHDDLANAVAGCAYYALAEEKWSPQLEESRMPVTRHGRPEQKEVVRQEQLKATLEDDMSGFYDEKEAGACRISRRSIWR